MERTICYKENGEWIVRGGLYYQDRYGYIVLVDNTPATFDDNSLHDSGELGYGEVEEHNCSIAMFNYDYRCQCGKHHRG